MRYYGRVHRRKKKNFSLEIQDLSPETELIYSETVSEESIEEAPQDVKLEDEELFKIEDFNFESELEIPFEGKEEETVLTVEPVLETTSETQELKDIPEEQNLSAAELFEQRQRQYLIGKKVTKAIYNMSGGIIINSGEIITEEIINEVKANGKLIELVMNYEE